MRGQEVLSGAFASFLAVTLAACGNTTTVEDAQTAAQEDAPVGQNADASFQATIDPVDTYVGKTTAELPMRVETEDGTEVNLSTIAKGRPLVANFWATWCDYCMDEVPEFQSVVAEYGDWSRLPSSTKPMANGRREIRYVPSSKRGACKTCRSTMTRGMTRWACSVSRASRSPSSSIPRARSSSTVPARLTRWPYGHCSIRSFRQSRLCLWWAAYCQRRTLWVSMGDRPRKPA